MLPTYNYDALALPTSVRLISLAPANISNALRCKIFTTNLGTSSAYEAISYVWGSEDDKPFIEIETDGETRQLAITQNLAAGLRRLRYQSTWRMIWTDAICIDQNNEDEKAVQVPLMGEIYRQARCVLIWLGEDPNPRKPTLANSCISSLVAAFKEARRIDDHKFEGLPPWQRDSLPIVRRSRNELHRALNIPLLESAEFQAFLELLTLPWFSRAWTWQEAFLAEHLFAYRSGEIWPGRHLMGACVVVFELRKITGQLAAYGSAFGVAMQMLRGSLSRERRNRHGDLTDLLSERRGLGCKYPSDLIYSLLGSVNDGHCIQVEYKKPFENVFMEFAWQTIAQRKDLSILRYLERDRKTTTLPTWVPNWTVPVFKERDTTSVLSNRQYRASGSTELRARVSNDHRILAVSGIHWDRISVIYPADAADLEQWASVNFESPEQLQKLYVPTNESLGRALRRVWFLDTLAFRDGNDTTRWQGNSHEEYEEIINKVEADKSDQADQTSILRYRKLLYSMVIKRDKRTIFKTEQGRLGMAANIIQSGDSLDLMFGSDRPFVLRQLQNSANHYTYVTDCYVHGFMDGEILTEVRKAADCLWNQSSTSWLEGLREGSLPFPSQEFYIH